MARRIRGSRARVRRHQTVRFLGCAHRNLKSFINVSKQPMSATATSKHDRLERVQGRISFVPRTPDEGPLVPTPEGFGDLPLVDREVEIRNARPITGELSLDCEGFILVKQRVSSINEPDPVVMAEKYQD